MLVQNAIQLKRDKKGKSRGNVFTFTQPLQFLPKKEKDDVWCAFNMDWLEWNGLLQMQLETPRLLKNYRLAEGIIDSADYIKTDENDCGDLVDYLQSNAEKELDAFKLKPYPIIPPILNTLTAEFAAMQKGVKFFAVDEYTKNEIKNKKKSEIENTLVRDYSAKLANMMIEAGADPNDPEIRQALEEQTSIENIKTLPEIQHFFEKDFVEIGADWATKVYLSDQERFSMEELETRAFRDKLITDREFWHFLMFENDYEVELLNPVSVFYQKTTSVRYISDANYAGFIELMSASDVIDRYGWRMTEDQLLSLEAMNGVFGMGLVNKNYAVLGNSNNGDFYDQTKTHEWNTEGPSVAYKQYAQAAIDKYVNALDAVTKALVESEDYKSLYNKSLCRVTTGYWKSQQRIGFLTKIASNGEVITDWISEDYQVTDKPIYNNTLFKENTERNLVFGEHIEWFWVNQVYGGVKIGPNIPTYYGASYDNGVAPIYLGINTKGIAPLKFQFKGDDDLYGAKLPIEGCVFNDRNVRSNSLVDLLKPSQIGANLMANQIQDICIDEIGTVAVINPKMLPKHSLGEEWGDGNLAKAYISMKDFSMLPLDGSIDNMNAPNGFMAAQMLDLQQSQRLVTRIQLFNFFKNEAFQIVGVSPQRMGQQLGVKTSATEAEQIQIGSYAQTERHFIEHSEYLMPRVHKMRTDLAQWYAVTNPSIRMRLLTAEDEAVFLEYNGDDLMLKDINVFCSARVNEKRLVETLKQSILNNNTTGASVTDLGSIADAQTKSQITNVLKTIEKRQEAQRKEQMEHEQEMLRMEEEAKAAEAQAKRDHETELTKLKIAGNNMAAEIRAAGYTAMADRDENNQSDFFDYMNELKSTTEYNEQVNVASQSMQLKREEANTKADLKREELATKREVAQKKLEGDIVNKNKWDFVGKKVDKKDK